jgi:hypothetical protein
VMTLVFNRLKDKSKQTMKYIKAVVYWISILIFRRGVSFVVQAIETSQPGCEERAFFFFFFFFFA